MQIIFAKHNIADMSSFNTLSYGFNEISNNGKTLYNTSFIIPCR